MMPSAPMVTSASKLTLSGWARRWSAHEIGCPAAGRYRWSGIYGASPGSAVGQFCAVGHWRTPRTGLV